MEESKFQRKKSNQICAAYYKVNNESFDRF